MYTHAFNKDCDAGEEKSDALFGRMPAGTSCFCNSDFGASIKLSRRCLLYIGHVTDIQKNRIVEAFKSRKSVFIRCSSAGRAEHRHSVSGKLTILELRPDYHELSAQEWKVIVAWVIRTRNTISGVVDGCVPLEVQRYFGDLGSPVYLTALSILCQGYLALQIAPDGSVAADIPKDDKGAIVRAVKRMFGQGQPVAINCGDPAKRNTLCKEAEGGDFWSVFRDDQGGTVKPGAELLGICQKEWDRVANGKGNFDLVKPLIVAIGAKKEKSAVLIARAYSELAAKLGGLHG